MVSCAACSSTKSKTCGLTFHSFPKNANKCKVWVNFVGKNNWKQKRSHVLCSKHFSEDCFDRTSINITRLKPDAVPTIHITRIKHVQQQNQIEILKPKLEDTVENKVRDTITLKPESMADVSFFPTANDTPRELALKRKIREMADINVIQSKKIRKLQLKNNYQKRKILNLKESMHLKKMTTSK